MMNARRLPLAIAAAALVSLATIADAKPSRHPAPKPAAAQCTTDCDCERLHGAGNWFPHRAQPTPEPEAEVGTRHWVSGSSRPIWAIPQARIVRRT